MSTLINVCGAAHSGTTLLDVMLGNSPNAFSLGEVCAWFRPYRQHHHKIDCSCGQDPCPVWQDIKDLPQKTFHAKAFDILSIDFLIDSSKDLLWIIDNNGWAAQNHFKVINLLIWKDPLGLAYSHWKRKEALNAWKRAFTGYYAKFFQTNLPYLSISYTKLVQDPAGYLEKICTAIGMSYFPGKERFTEKAHHFLFGSASIRREIQQGLSQIFSIEACPADFLQDAQKFLQEVENDAELQELLRKLQEREITNLNSSVLDVDTENRSKIKHPLWYYPFVLRRYYRRFFTQKYHQTL